MACTAADFQFLREIVFSQSLNRLDPARDYLFATRLAALLQKESIASLEDLVASLRRAPQPRLARAIAEAMTINETSFFRDGRPFELLRFHLLPELIRNRRHQRKLTFWSAACSSGQEVYSLAMLLREYFPLLLDWKLVILGTDISEEMVRQAKSGEYAPVEVRRGLPSHMLSKYFEPKGELWQIRPEIRALCTFRQMALNPPLAMRTEPFDGILLRNVMLYFSDETRHELLSCIHRLLRPDGFLVLGSSELPEPAALWEPVLAHGTCYYRPKASEVCPGPMTSKGVSDR